MEYFQYRLPLKERMERMIQKRRDRDQHREETWSNTAKYFSTWETRVNKFNDWTSTKYYEDSQKSYEDHLRTERKKQTLETRRENLKEMLRIEAAGLQKELDDIEKEYRPVSKQRSKKKVVDSIEQIEYLRHQAAEMERRKEEERQKEVTLKDFLRWKANNPVIRDLESRYHTQFVRKAWDDQVQEKIQRDKVAKEQNLKIEEDVAKYRDAELKKLQELQEQKRKEIESWKAEISKQTQQIKIRDEMTKKLQKQLDDIASQQSLLEETMDARSRFIRTREQGRQLANFWGKQTRLKIRALCKDRLDSIIDEHKTLEYLKRLDAKRLDDQKNANTDLSDKIEAVRRCLESHRQLEIAREKESAALFEEEARAYLKQQEILWENERKMREKLMFDVTSTLEKQIEEKRLNNKRNQEALEAEKAKILSEIEERDKQIEVEERALRQRMEDWQTELTQQIYEKRKQKEKEMLESLDMLTRVKFQEDQEKLLVNAEESRLNLDGYKPKFFGRCKVAW